MHVSGTNRRFSIPGSAPVYIQCTLDITEYRSSVEGTVLHEDGCSNATASPTEHSKGTGAVEKVEGVPIKEGLHSQAVNYCVHVRYIYTILARHLG